MSQRHLKIKMAVYELIIFLLPMLHLVLFLVSQNGTILSATPIRPRNRRDSWLHLFPCPPFLIHLQPCWCHLLNSPRSVHVYHLAVTSPPSYHISVHRLPAGLLASLWFSLISFSAEGLTATRLRTLPLAHTRFLTWPARCSVVWGQPSFPVSCLTVPSLPEM